MLPNEFDLLMIIFLVVGIIYGALRGAMRQTTGLLSTWLGLIICLWLYQPFGRQILKGLFLKMAPKAQASNAIFDTLAFVILIITFIGLVQLLFVFSSQSPEEKRDRTGKTFVQKANRKQATITSTNVFNLFGGTITGFISAAIWLSLILAPTQYVLLNVDNSGNFQYSLRTAMNSSLLMPYFDLILHWLYLSVRLFIPSSGLPGIFSHIV